MDDEDPDAGPGERLARLLAASVLEGVEAFPSGAAEEDLVRYLRGDTPGGPGEAAEPEDTEGRLWFSKKQPLESLVEALVSEGLLEYERSPSGPPRLEATPEGRRFLADPGAVDVALAGFGRSTGPEGASPLSEEETEQYERLRSLRNERAEDRDVPPYIICDNDTLKAVARRRPTSRSGLSAISGIGPSFMENHADVFLGAIAAASTEGSSGDSTRYSTEAPTRDASEDSARDSTDDPTAGAARESAEDSTAGDASVQTSVEEVGGGGDDEEPAVRGTGDRETGRRGTDERETRGRGADDRENHDRGAGDREAGGDGTDARETGADGTDARETGADGTDAREIHDRDTGASSSTGREAPGPEASNPEATYQGDGRRRDRPRTARRPDPPSRDEALEVLSSVFGHESFLPGQWEVIERVLAGESAVAVFPTGGGKSLCYQLPAVTGDATTLVVSPLKALMKDQVDALQEKGVAAAREDSSTGFRESQETLASFAEADLDVLYVAPERFNNDRFVDALSEATIDVLAIDEAHCISEWGHSFRPDYLKLARYADEWEIPQVLGLTATATERVARDMCASFGVPTENVVRLPSHRENLDLHVRPVTRDTRYEALVAALEEDPVGPTIVYAKRRRTTERLADELVEDGFPARAFHAGLDDEAKDEIQDWFMDSSDGVIVATIAFGMGVDKPDIRRIVHHNLPSSLESYAQQVGRAGRDGERSRCTLLYCPDDVNLCTNYEWGSTPARPQFQAVLERVLAPGTDDGATGELQTLDFLAYEKEVGVRRTTVRTLVALLENEGFLQQHTPVNAKFRYRLLEPEATVEDGLPDEDRALFQTIQDEADHKQKWSHLHVPSFVEETGIPRSRVGDLLDTLSQRGYAHVTARDYVYPYEILAKPDDLPGMARRYQETFQGLEDRAVQRVRDVPRRLSEAPCIWTAIAEHFGETVDGPCGHCSTCLDGGEPPDLPLPEAKPIPDEAGEHLAEALEQAPELAEEPMTLAEFLCGRYSIGVRTHGLHSLEGYRCLEFHGLEDVVGWVRGEVGGEVG